jgi:hypothetical protein
LLQVAENAQPLADKTADNMEEAAHVAATRAVEVTDAAAEAGVQATKDVSKVRPGRAAGSAARSLNERFGKPVSIAAIE